MKKYVKSDVEISEDEKIDIKYELREAMDKVLSEHGLADYYAKSEIEERKSSTPNGDFVYVGVEILCSYKG